MLAWFISRLLPRKSLRPRKVSRFDGQGGTEREASGTMTIPANSKYIQIYIAGHRRLADPYSCFSLSSPFPPPGSLKNRAPRHNGYAITVSPSACKHNPGRGPLTHGLGERSAPTYLNLLLYTKFSPTSPFSSRSATADHWRLKAHSTWITNGFVLVTSVM